MVWESGDLPKIQEVWDIWSMVGTRIIERSQEYKSTVKLNTVPSYSSGSRFRADSDPFYN